MSQQITRRQSTIPISAAILATALFALSAFAVCAFARDHHTDLNGTWSLVPTKSDFAGQPVMQTGTLTINERQSNITVSRNFVYEGANGTLFYRDMTDSANSATIHEGKDLKSKTRWDHDVLKVTTTQSGAVTEESYTLSADGRSLVVNVVKEGRPLISLFFERE